MNCKKKTQRFAGSWQTFTADRRDNRRAPWPIRKTIHDLQYGVKWKKAYYGLPGRGWIIEMVAYDVLVNLVFFAGAKFNPEPPQGEGSRYIKIRTIEEAKAPEVRDWIKQAAKHPGWR